MNQRLQRVLLKHTKLKDIGTIVRLNKSSQIFIYLGGYGLKKIMLKNNKIITILRN